jgi:hypothetical protein
LALHQAGRSAAALEAIRRYGRLIDDELGLEIGPSLRDLQGAILRQDSELTSWPRVRPSDTPGIVEPATTAADRRTGAVSSKEDSAGDQLIGRERETALVVAALNEAAAGATRWLVLTGGAGIGKSRLAQEAVRRWPHRVLRTGCPDDDGAPAWWPVRQWLRLLGEQPDRVLTPPADVDTDAARFAVYDRVLETIAAALAEGPLLLLVEDVHWADPTTLRFLSYLAETVDLPCLAVLITVRDAVNEIGTARLLAAAARRPGTRQLAVPPLDRAGVATLAGRISGVALSPAQSLELTEKTAGNPFFVAEYARLPERDRLAGEVPGAVRAVLRQRLAGLRPAVLQVLQTAAVMTDPMDVDVLGAVTGIDRNELDELLDDAAAEHVLVHDPDTGTYRFAHALLRDEAAAGLSPVRRQRVHLRIAAAVEHGGGPDRLVRRAASLVSAGSLADAADTFLACRAAAVDAEHRWIPDAAARWWGEAVKAFDRIDTAARVGQVDRDDLVVAQVSAFARAGRGQTVLDVLDSEMLDAIRRGRPDSVGRMAAALLRTSGSWPWAAYGEDPGALLSRLSGLETLVRTDPAAHARVLAALAVGSCYHPDRRVPDRLSQQAIDLAQQLDDPEVLADALLGRALTYAGVADRAAESVALLGRLTALEHRNRRIDEVAAHGALFMAKMELGTADADEHVRLGTLGSDLLRLTTSRVQFRWAEGTVALWQGNRLGEAEAIYTRALDLHRQSELYEAGVFDVAMLTVRWEQGMLHDCEYPGAANPRVVPWAAAICAAAQHDPAADELISAELRRPEPIIWTTHGRLTMLAHAVADARLPRHVPELLERLAPYRNGIALIGQVGVAGPVALAMARLALLLDDHAGARALLATAVAVAERTRGHGSLVRCALLRQQIDQQELGRVDCSAVADIARQAERRGLLGVLRDAEQLAAS